MRFTAKLSLTTLMVVCSSCTWAASSGSSPYIGYAFPAGGRQGSTVRVDIGGQRLRGVTGAIFVGGGVTSSFVEYESGSGPLNNLQQDELRRRIGEIQAKRSGKKPEEKKPDGTVKKPVELPDLPELRDLDQKTPKELNKIREKFLDRSKRPKPPVEETVTLDMTIDPNAAPGDREIRLISRDGLSNPIIFQVSKFHEIVQNYDREDGDTSATSAECPAILNGHIMPGAVDKFALDLRKGQRLSIVADARHLMPYLADAVPGWFQALMTLRDRDGREVASSDHCAFDPDPVISYEVTSDGNYTLEIRDSLYRGREDFVYRIALGEDAQGNSIWLGRRDGVLPSYRTSADPFAPSSQSYLQFVRNPLPECEAKTSGEDPQGITLPHMIRGCISKAGVVDTFRISGHVGERIVAEVYARRLGSPLDSLLTVVNSKGKVIAMNDDTPDPDEGLLTHHADSYLSAKLPATGDYFIKIRDIGRHGGDRFKYYLRISHPQPNFALQSDPSSLNIPAGHDFPFTVHAVRKDGWDGPIEVTLKNAPAGYELSGNQIPSGRNCVRMTLFVPRGKDRQPLAIHLEGRAVIEGKAVVRSVIPTENMMQAFAYQHLVPSRELLIMPKPGGSGQRLEVVSKQRIRIPAGGQSKLQLRVKPMPQSSVQLELVDPPAGISLSSVSTKGDIVTAVIKADPKQVPYADNLIVDGFAFAKPKGQRYALGTFPAVPFEIVKK